MTDAGSVSSARGTWPLLRIFLTSEHRSLQLQGQLAAAGWHIVLLPAPATGMRIGIDQPVDAPLAPPLEGWAAPRGLIALARAAADGAHQGWSRDQRLLAFEAGGYVYGIRRAPDAL